MSLSCSSSWMFSGSSVLFHSGQAVQAVGFLLPQTFVLSRILLHVLLATSHAILAAWALSTNCSEDVLVWAVALGAVNVGQTMFLSWKHWPHNLPDEVMELYHKKFEAYGLSVGDMAVIVKGSTVESGAQEARLMWNDSPNSLAFLLSGRLVASLGDLKLHTVEPGQCVNSVEWRAGANKLNNVEIGDQSGNFAGWNFGENDLQNMQNGIQGGSFGENDLQNMQNVECGILQCVKSQQWKKGFRPQKSSTR